MKWIFASRFRRHAFGWRSDTPVLRIKEALAEIKAVAKGDPVLAAEGAISLLEKLSPALEHVDSSSGVLGNAVNRAIETLVPIIARADVDPALRQRWLTRLWVAIEDDGIPYIESLAEFWGELCASPKMASEWADTFLPEVKRVWGTNGKGSSYSKRTTPCLASLQAAGRHDELLALLERAPFAWWHDRRWGVKALVALGRPSEAVRYAEASRGLNDPGWQIAQACEAILLSSGLADEAYRRYAIEAHRGSTHLATFRAIVKQYPHKRAEDILTDLVASTPLAEGQWFAAAKQAKLFDLALELAARGPTDPRTLTRAARDFATQRPEFAIECAVQALHWMARGKGYEITGADVLDAYSTLVTASKAAGHNAAYAVDRVHALIAQSHSHGDFIKTTLRVSLSS